MKKYINKNVERLKNTRSSEEDFIHRIICQQ